MNDQKVLHRLWQPSPKWSQMTGRSSFGPYRPL